MILLQAAAIDGCEGFFHGVLLEWPVRHIAQELLAITICISEVRMLATLSHCSKMSTDEMSKVDGYECSASSFASMQYFHALFVLSSFSCIL
jgi:hypothetical protein